MRPACLPATMRRMPAAASFTLLGMVAFRSDWHSVQGLALCSVATHSNAVATSKCLLPCLPNGYLPSHPKRAASTSLSSFKNNDDGDTSDEAAPFHSWIPRRIVSTVTSSPARSVAFSALMALSGAALGPFLDSFHSAYGVLQYDAPWTAQLWGVDVQHPALITAWWVPELFGLAGVLIGWLYLLLDATYDATSVGARAERRHPPRPPPSPPQILVGISIFTFQYWLSGVLFHSGVDRTTILNVMSVTAAVGFWTLDNTMAGLVTSATVALGGPLIEVALLTLSKSSDAIFHGTGYHYTDPGETGFFPLWIVPIYFLGGPANGNLARGYWTALGLAFPIPDDGAATSETAWKQEPPGCPVCHDTRSVPCPHW